MHDFAQSQHASFAVTLVEVTATQALLGLRLDMPLTYSGRRGG